MGNLFSEVTCKPDMAAAALHREDGSALARRLTPVQWLICGIACLGFAFDLYETLMTALIVRPVLSTLGNLRIGTPEFNLWVGLFFFLPGVAGGIFGLLGGYLTDRLGRRRVLVWSMLLYAFSACAAGFATSLPLLLFLRCTTWIGTCVEQVAAITWLAELFENPKQRQSVLGYTQVAFGFGGMMVTAAYYLSVTYAERFPAIYGAHEPWRYTLLSGLIPAIPLILVRPFLPESPIWHEKKATGTLKRTRVKELFRPALRKTTLWVTLMMACSFALPFGALQHTPRMIPGLVSAQKLAPRQVEQTVSRVYMVQELGSLAGRLAFAVVVVYFVRQRRLLRVFVAPATVVFCGVFFYAATHSLTLLIPSIFCAQALFNGVMSFWGNYLPRIYPTHVRGTGESFGYSIGGRAIGISAALLTTTLSNVLPGGSPAVRLAHSAGTVAICALAVLLVGSFLLPEPRGNQLPE
jgi:MFS family permease